MRKGKNNYTEEPICSVCYGTGDGQNDYEDCYACGGSGIETSGSRDTWFDPSVLDQDDDWDRIAQLHFPNTFGGV